MKEALYDVLKAVAPGTAFREGLENILKARTGGLIVIGDTKEVLDVVDGGFNINKEYTPSYIYELAKMDGAIVVSKDMKTILYANAQLIPDPSISTSETGTRHRTAERVAKQTGEVVISISQRRNVITIFKGNQRYILRDSSVVLTKANQAIQTLEKYKSALNGVMNNLSALEFEDMTTLENVCVAIQRTEMVSRISNEIKQYIYELGDEGRLVKMQLEQLAGTIDDDMELLLRDYVDNDKMDEVDDIISEIRGAEYSTMLDSSYIGKLIGYSGSPYSELVLSPKGYRVLSMIPRLPTNIIDNLVKEFSSLNGIVNANIQQLDDVEGIGEVRARTIKEGLRRMRDQILFDIRF